MLVCWRKQSFFFSSLFEICWVLETYCNSKLNFLEGNIYKNSPWTVKKVICSLLCFMAVGLNIREGHPLCSPLQMQSSVLLSLFCFISIVVFNFLQGKNAYLDLLTQMWSSYVSDAASQRLYRMITHLFSIVDATSGVLYPVLASDSELYSKKTRYSGHKPPHEKIPLNE